MSQLLTGSMKKRLISSTKNITKKAEKEDISHVTAWAVNFDILLHDKSGLRLFEDFLKLEYSEENIEFWRECENFKDINDSCTRRLKARALFEKFMSPDSPQAINIDDVARKRIQAQLDSPTTEVFSEAQSQIYNLMKQDSYPRFLKSDIFKNRLMNKMERKLHDLQVSMDTRCAMTLDKKGGSLQRHFKYWNKNETVIAENTKNNNNHQNSWIRRRVDSVNSMFRRNTRKRH